MQKKSKKQFRSYSTDLRRIKASIALLLAAILMLSPAFDSEFVYASSTSSSATSGETKTLTAEMNLSDMGLAVYNELKTAVKKIASGKVTSSVVTMELSFTYAELGVSDFESARNIYLNNCDTTDIFNCLIFDCPYELYWCDKTEGVDTHTSYTYNSTKMDLTLTWTFAVSEDYQGSSATKLNSSKVKKAVAAAENAQAIVDKYADKSDLEKLTAYRDEICALVSYQSDYASAGYGDYQQLIYVFDGKSSTNVVCEGYSKAFQYLCDLSTFDNAVCYTVDGNMTGGTGAGEHMWNLVCLNGINYMVDVTNSDDGTAGEDGGLFMVCADDAKSITVNSYSFKVSSKTIAYTYNSKTKDVYKASLRTLGTEKSFSTSSKCSVTSVANTKSGLKVTWGKVSGAVGYYVYRITSGGSYSKVKTITGGFTVSWTDTSSLTSGKTYRYKVIPYGKDSSGNTLVGKAGTTKNCVYLKAGEISSLKNTSSGITVKWSKVKGASGYYVYRKTGSGSYSKVKTLKSGSTVSWTDTAVKSKNGTTYTYYVIPYYKSSSGNITEGSYSATKKTVRLTGVSISSLTNSSSKKMTVKWAKNSKATGYQIQYSTSSSFESGNKTVSVSSASTVSKVISSLTKDKTYYVRVRAYKTVSGTKYYSAWSSKKSVKISK